MPTVPLNKLFNEIRETDDFLVYEVASSRKKVTPWRVDLQRYNGNGYCPCESFTASKDIELNGIKVTKKQALDKGAFPHPSLECKHIASVKRYLIQKVLNEILDIRERETKANKQKAKASRTVGDSIPAPAPETDGWIDEEPLVV